MPSNVVHAPIHILCIGNRYLAPDHAAIEIFHLAQASSWPDAIRWIEGGLGGLNLWPYFEHCQQVWVLDYLPTLPNAQYLPLKEMTAHLPQTYDHNTAFQYCLQTLPQLVTPLPDIFLMSCRPEAPDWQQQVLQTLKDALKSTLTPQLYPTYDSKIL